MKKSIMVAIAFCIAGVVGMSAASANPLDFENAIGIYGMVAQNTEVYGIQYQRWVSDKVGLQFLGSVYYNPTTGYISNPLDYNVSAEVQYKLFETPFGERSGTCLYAWGLAGHRGYIKNSYLISETTGETEKSASEFKPVAIVGMGFGFDIMFVNHLSVPVEFGFLGQFPYDPGFGFSFGSGLRYRF